RRSRRRFRPAAQARPVAGGFGRRGGRVVADVRVLRSAHRADRPAVDAGGRDGDEESPVEPRIARLPRPTADALVEIHPPPRIDRRPLSLRSKTDVYRQFTIYTDQFTR